MDKNVNMKDLYYIVFKDGTTFQGGEDYWNTKWKEIPDKPIERIFYRMPHDGLILYGYEKYYHMVECTQDIYGSNKKRLEYAYIMGKKKDKIICYRIALCDKGQDKDYAIEKHLVGDIKIMHETEDSAFIKSLKPSGWK